jgi:hypothetical protein
VCVFPRPIPCFVCFVAVLARVREERLVAQLRQLATFLYVYPTHVVDCFGGVRMLFMGLEGLFVGRLVFWRRLRSHGHSCAFCEATLASGENIGYTFVYRGQGGRLKGRKWQLARNCSTMCGRTFFLMFFFCHNHR